MDRSFRADDATSDPEAGQLAAANRFIGDCAAYAEAAGDLFDGKRFPCY